MTEQQKQGWTIMGTFYPHVGVEELRHGDFALVREATGLTADEFVDGDDLTGSESGWIAVAFWHGHPEFTRDRVRSIIEQLLVKDVERKGFDVPAAEGDAGPPDETPSPGSSETGDGSSSTTSTAPEAQETATQP